MTENDNLTRIPQAFSFDTNAISRTYGEQASLIRDILVFLANKTTTGFFEDYIFSLDDFCKEFGYRKDELQKTLPQFVNCPEHLKPYEDGHCFDSVFEYALYVGFTKVLVFSVKKFKEDGFDLRNMVLFEAIRAIYKKTGRNEKRYYQVELDYRIKDMQLTRFFLTDKEQYRIIQIPHKQKLTGGLRNFYLYIGRMIAIVKYNIKQNADPFYIISVDEVAKIMELSIIRNDKRKAKVRDYIDKINLMLGEYGFTYSFCKGAGQRYEYSIKFFFPQNTLDYFDEKNKARFFHKLKENVQTNYFRNVVNAGENKIGYLDWSKFLSSDDERKLTKWLFDKNSDSFYLAKIYFLETFRDIYGIDYDNRFGEI